jgi:hypothetical protein
MASPDQSSPVPVPRGTPVLGPVAFETVGDITVQPLQGRVYHKRRPSNDERDRLSEVLLGLEAIYGIAVGSPYVTTPLFADGLADPAGIDVLGESVDEALWIALLAATPEAVPAARRAFEQEPVILNSGVVPRLVLPDPDPAGPPPAPLPRLWEWEITSARPTASSRSIVTIPTASPGRACNGCYCRPPRTSACRPTTSTPMSGPASATGRRAWTIPTLRRGS